MDLVNGYLVQLGNWMRPHIMLVAMAQVATLLTIYGDHINVVVRVLVKPYHFILRLAAFVALCTFGYGQGIAWALAGRRGDAFYRFEPAKPTRKVKILFLGILDGNTTRWSNPGGFTKAWSDFQAK